MRRADLGLLILLAPLWSCHILFPFSRAEPSRDVLADGASRDGLVPAEGGTDRRDGLVRDQAARDDKPSVDRRRDTPTLLWDKKPADKAGQIEATTPPCASGVSPGQMYSPTMIVCNSSQTVDQCNAHLLCNEPAWHLCKASEFKARNGTTTPAQDSGWIASCSRVNSKDQAPSEDICPACNPMTQPGLTTSTWDCSGADPINSDLRHLGVINCGVCRRVGINNSSNGAFWQAYGSGSNQLAAICCR